MGVEGSGDHILRIGRGGLHGDGHDRHIALGARRGDRTPGPCDLITVLVDRDDIIRGPYVGKNHALIQPGECLGDVRGEERGVGEWGYPPRRPAPPIFVPQGIRRYPFEGLVHVDNPAAGFGDLGYS